MRILVVSDIHAFSVAPDDGKIPSYVKAGDTAAGTPTKQFIELLKLGKIPKPDVIVCPGDLCHQADAPGLESAWHFLREVMAECPGSLLAATVGNHDIHSRLSGDQYDPKGTLLTLDPSYPVVGAGNATVDSGNQLLFWAKNYCVFSKGDVRFVILNSSAFHGYGRSETDQEYEHGRISGYTLSAIENALTEDNDRRATEGLGPVTANVLVCHHHLQPDGLIDDGDKSVMKGANALVTLMQKTELGRWLVIHGHRHRARLYQHGGAGGPWIISAASFSATKDGDYANYSPNQVHLIELDFAGMTTTSIRPAGHIMSWTWRKGLGWSNENVDEKGLPPRTGFGWIGSLDHLAKAVDGLLPGSDYVPWNTLVATMPELSFVPHDKLDELRKTLTLNHKVDITFLRDGSPLQVGRSQ